jgi:hypothetical protein
MPLQEEQHHKLSQPHGLAGRVLRLLLAFAPLAQAE